MLPRVVYDNSGLRPKGLGQSPHFFIIHIPPITWLLIKQQVNISTIWPNGHWLNTSTTKYVFWLVSKFNSCCFLFCSPWSPEILKQRCVVFPWRQERTFQMWSILPIGSSMVILSSIFIAFVTLNISAQPLRLSYRKEWEKSRVNFKPLIKGVQHSNRSIRRCANTKRNMANVLTDVWLKQT